MKHEATAILWGNYKFSFKMPDNPTLHNMAWTISMAVHKSEGRSKFTGVPRTYNYLIEALRTYEGTFNFMRYNADSDKKDEIYAAANELQNESPFYKVKCDEHMGYGCLNCNGHGYKWERIGYRVGNTFDHVFVIDIDDHNRENMENVKSFYGALLGERFRIYETNGGFWLIGNKFYKTKEEFVFAHAKTLNPVLEFKELQEYRDNLLSLDKLDGHEFTPATPDMIRTSGFYTAPKNLNFDLTFAFLSIKREQSTLRESKKHPTDKIIEIIE